MNRIQIKIEKDFNLDHIFDCGQCFRWEKEEDGSYTGVASGKVARMAYEDGVLTIEGPGAGAGDGGAGGAGACDGACAGDEEFWRDYLDLDRDYGQIKKSLKGVGDAIEYGYGIRILNQDPWETLISFIISQNNNIPRIKGCIEKLCRLYGEPLGTFRGKEYFGFPGPEDLAEADLSEVKLGYRAGYITDTARRVCEQGMPEAGELLDCKGVGPKVANCILLFGYRKYDSFPIDVWMKKIMNQLYGFDEEDRKGMEKFARENFGQNSGFAQQYLFYYVRGLAIDKYAGA